MKNNFNCKIATEIINKIKQLKAEFDKELNNNVPRALEIRVKLKKELKEAFELFDPDQIAIREKIAKEKGFDYVGKFNKYGLARVAIDRTDRPETTRQSGSEPVVAFNNYLINMSGEIVFPKLETGTIIIKDFSEGMAAVTEFPDNDTAARDLVSYYINEQGEKINDKTFLTAQDLKLGVALVQYQGDNWQSEFHIIDQEGKELRKITLGDHEDMRWSKRGYLGLHKSRYGAWYITPTGDRLPKNPMQYWDELGNLSNGIAPVLQRGGVGDYKYKDDRHYYYINQQGERLKEGIFNEDFSFVTDFVGDFAIVRTHDSQEQYLIDRQGKKIKYFDQSIYGKVEHSGFSKDRIIFKKVKDSDKEYILTDYEGNIIFSSNRPLSYLSEDICFITGEHKEITYMNKNGLNTSSYRGEYTLLTKDGQIIKPEIPINGPNNFTDGVARVKRYNESNEEVYFYIDKKGRRVF